MDTFIALSNPNNGQVSNIQIYLYDKEGTLIWEGDMFDGGVQRDFCPANGWNYMTISKMINNAVGAGFVPEDDTMNKYNFIITWDKPAPLPYRHMICEVKQIIYGLLIEAYDAPWTHWQDIKTWSEVALGGKMTTGLYKK